MGDVCCKQHSPKEPVSDNLPFTTTSQKILCKTFRKSLERALSAHQSEVWFTETVNIVRSWQHTQSDEYLRRERWGYFLQLEQDSPFLQYQVGAKFQSDPRNLFDLLNADFLDERNPIGKLLATFRDEYLKQFKYQIEDCVEKKNKEEAETRLYSISILIMKFEQVLVNTTLEFYSRISQLLESRKEDLEGLLLAHLVQGDLYRLLEALAAVSQVASIDCLRAMLPQDSSHEHKFLTRYQTSPLIDRACKVIKDLLLEFSASENFYERRALLLRITNTIDKTAFSEEMKPVLVARAIVKTQGFLFPAQIFVTKQFLTESLDVYFKAISMIVQYNAKSEARGS